MATIFGTATNNTLLVEADDLRGLGGNDTYIITNATANAAGNNGTVVIQDTEGANRLQLADGLQIASVMFANNNAVQLTLSNGLRVQIIGANNFTFDIGGNSSAGDAEGLIGRNFQQLAQALGVTLDANGNGMSNTPVTVQPGPNPTTPVPPVPPSGTFTLTTGVDSGPAFTGGAGTDTFDARPANVNGVATPTLDQFDSIDGAGGRDTLIVDTVAAGAFVGVRNIEIVSAAGNVGLGAAAAAAGVDTLQMSQAAATNADIRGFNAALTVNGSAQNDTVTLNLSDAGNKTLNLGAGTATVNANGVTNAAAGSIVMSFVSADVGNGTGRVKIDGPNGDIDAGNTNIKFIGDQADQFSVIGSNAAGVLFDGLTPATSPSQDRGDFQTVVLGTATADTLSTTDNGNVGNVYINAGGGADELTAAADAGARHFLVGNGGNDVLTISTMQAASRVVALTGDDNDAVTVNQNDGAVSINLGNSDDTVSFTGAFGANRATGLVNDTVAGGEGRDTLATSSLNFSNINNTVANAVQSISGIEAITLRDALAHNIVLSRIQAGIDTVTLSAGINGNGNTITFDGGIAGTLNLAMVAGGQINVASAGTGTTDTVRIVNTAAANAGGMSLDVFNGRNITTLGTETLTLVGTGNGTATTQTIGGFNGGSLSFSGTNSFTANAALTSSGTVSAAGLTGAAALTATIAQATTVTGSANGDRITIAGTVNSAVNTAGGDDTVTLTALNANSSIDGTLSGGDGTGDTLVASVADASAFSTANGTSTKISGFEVLSLNAQPQAAVGQQAVNSIRLDNLGVNKVVSAGTAAGTPGTGNSEVVTFTPPSLAAGQSLTISAPGRDPVTITNTNNFLEDAGAVASRINSAFNAADANPANANSVVTQYDSAIGANNLVTLTAEIPFTNQNLNDLTISVANAPIVAPDFNPIQGVNTIAAVPEVTRVILDTSNMTNFAVYQGTDGDDGFQIVGRDLNGNPVNLNIFFPGQASGLTPELANLIKAVYDLNLGINAQFTANYNLTVDGNNVVITAKQGGARDDIQVVVPNALDGQPLNSNQGRFLLGQTAEVSVTTQGVNSIPATIETTTVVWKNLLQGQSVTVAGRTVEATMRNLSATEVADAFEQGQANLTITFPANGARVSGNLTGWELPAASNAAGDPLTNFRALTAGNVADLSTTFTSAQAPLATAPTPTITQGAAPGALGAAGQIILQNLQTNGTLEITAASTGTHTVEVSGSGLNTADVFNLVLSTATGTNFGTVSAANVERVNISSNGTAGAVDTLVLNAASADTIVITGNQGLNLTGALGAVKTLDASGVTAGGVTFAAQAMAVTIKGGAGDDNLTGSAVMDSIEAGAGNDIITAGGGNDTIVLGAGSDTVNMLDTLANNGLDTITGFTAGDIATNGDRIGLNQAAPNPTAAIDSNGGAAGITFLATAANTSGDLSIVNGANGANTSAYFVTDGNATINLANVKSQITGATAANGEILVADGASAYVLHAASAASTSFNVYRVFDNNANNGVVDAAVELLGVVSLTNTFGDIILANVT